MSALFLLFLGLGIFCSLTPIPVTGQGEGQSQNEEHCCTSPGKRDIDLDDTPTPTILNGIRPLTTTHNNHNHLRQSDLDLELDLCPAAAAATDATGSPEESCPGPELGGVSYGPPKNKRYVLYDLHPGEGFNLRRDIFVRIGPLIRQLNEGGGHRHYGDVHVDVDVDMEEWILVLPPWRNLPHWRKSSGEGRGLPWSTFFDLEEISKYIPVLEAESFLNERGQSQGRSGDVDIDTVINLSHFPFPDPGGEDPKAWEVVEEVKETPCIFRKDSQFKFQEVDSLFKGQIWGQSSTLTASQVRCVSLRGTASTLRPYLERVGRGQGQGQGQGSGRGSTSILLNSAEVILWDEYGGEEWWRGRAALKFAQNLVAIANSYAAKQVAGGGAPYLSVHLRRRDFLGRKGDSPPPSLQDVATQVSRLCKNLQLSSLFLATDAERAEIEELKGLLNQNKIRVWTFPCANTANTLSEGECAIIDQILASHWSTHFIGTEGSTFTLRIFEERLLLGKTPASTYNVLCANVGVDVDTQSKPTSTSSPCPSPTKWLIPPSLQHLIHPAPNLDS